MDRKHTGLHRLSEATRTRGETKSLRTKGSEKNFRPPKDGKNQHFFLYRPTSRTTRVKDWCFGHVWLGRRVTKTKTQPQQKKSGWTANCRKMCTERLARGSSVIQRPFMLKKKLKNDRWSTARYRTTTILYIYITMTDKTGGFNFR